MNVVIRRYRPADRDAVYHVCVQTAEGGQGAGGLYSTDDLVPDIFAGPYLELEPGHAYVLDDGGRAVGYIIGTPDTAAFVAAYQARWLPFLRTRYRPLAGAPATREERRLDVMFHPERLLLPELAAYPAHLHINLLAGYRRGGHGRALMETFLASVAAAGAPACYLVVRTANLPARRFYDKLGWQAVPVADPGDGIFMARQLAGRCL